MSDEHGPFDSGVIANRMLDIADDNNIPLTVMQLLKLIFIAQGWYLTFTGKQLTKDNPEAWTYGPGYRAVFKELSDQNIHIGALRAKDLVTRLIYEPDISDEINGLLETVVESYGKFHSFELIDTIFTKSRSWDETLKEIGLNNEIPPEYIIQHFDFERAA